MMPVICLCIKSCGKPPRLRDGITILESLRGMRKFFIELKYSNRGIDSRQGAKQAKFGGRD